VRAFAASSEAGRISIVQGFFDEARAAEVAGRSSSKPLLFFCDIRTADTVLMSPEEVEKSVERDMDRQRVWVENLRPTVSLLKFRLPWGPGATKYLGGRILVQAFPPCTSTETRLLVTREALEQGPVSYDQEEYEQRLMHHNTVSRARLHQLPVPKAGPDAVLGLDQCFDCAALALTVQRYLAARDGVAEGSIDRSAVAREITALIAEVTESGRSLASPYHVSSSRHGGRQFKKRRYVDAAGEDSFAVERCGTKEVQNRRPKRLRGREAAEPREPEAAASVREPG